VDEKEIEKKEEMQEEPKVEEVKMELPTTEEMAEEKPEEEKKEESPADEKQEDEEEKPESEKKEMSLDSNLDVAAFLAMLAEETEDYQALVAKHQAGEELDHAKVYALAYAKMCKMADELKKAKEDGDVYMSANEELKQFKADVEAKQFAFEVESTIAEVSDTMPKEEIEKARENSKNFTLETVGAWKNEIKALAFSLGKDKKVDDGVNRIAMSWVDKKDRNKQDLSKGWVK